LCRDISAQPTSVTQTEDHHATPAPEANNTLTTRSTIGYWNQSSWSGTAPLVMTAMPIGIVSHSIVTPAYSVKVKKNFSQILPLR
jgi:hypothetical protein